LVAINIKTFKQLGLSDFLTISIIIFAQMSNTFFWLFLRSDSFNVFFATNERGIEMSWEAIYHATKQTAGSSTDKLVLLMLANLADEKGFCFPSYQYLARVAEMNERTVQRSINRLCGSGLLKKRARYNGDGQTSNGYYVVMDSEPTPLDSEPTPPRHKADTPLDTVPTYTKNNNLKDKHKKKVEQYPEDFDVFWKAYPRRPNDNKWNAFSKWKSAINGVIETSDLLNAALKFKVASTNTDPKFIPMCATWLNQRRYLDELGEVKRNRNSLAG
jgi:hypothetical protein